MLLNSGHASLHAALMGLEVGPGERGDDDTVHLGRSIA